jgi:hypothetical protein
VPIVDIGPGAWTESFSIEIEKRNLEGLSCMDSPFFIGGFAEKRGYLKTASLKHDFFY